jgi:hypothetical protein
MKTSTPLIFITWAQVMAYCRRVSVGEHTARKMFWRECPARKVLPGCKKARYDRLEVLKELGLPSDSDKQS